MRDERLRRLFDLAEELYTEKEKEHTGGGVMPFAWVKNNKTGELIIVSCFGKMSSKILDTLKKEYGL